MIEKMESKLNFIDYIVEKVEFSINLEFNNENGKIDFDIDSNVEFVDDENFLLSLFVEVFKDCKKNNYPFNLRLKLTGIFSLKNVDEDKKYMYAEKNAVAILFPYVRALITSYTSASNVNALILPPINVAKYLEEKRNNKK